MTAAKNIAFHTIVKPFVVHGEFLGEETLVKEARTQREVYEKYVDESARVLRDRFLAFQAEVLRDSRKKDNSLREYSEALLQYLGYGKDYFVQESVEIEDGLIRIPVLVSESHSIACLCLFDVDKLEMSPDFDVDLTAFTTQNVSQKKSLAEFADMVLKARGLSDVLVLAPARAFWFRADSTTGGACLECNLDDVFAPDQDLRIGFMEHLLGATAFEDEVLEGEAASVSEESETGDSSDEDEDDEDVVVAGATSHRSNRAAKLIVEDLEAKRQITEDLHRQVTTALELLVNHRLEQDQSFRSVLKKNPAVAESFAQEIFRDGLFFVYRILFILYAEAREVLPTGTKEYQTLYSIDSLLDWIDDFQRQERIGLLSPDGSYVWHSLRALFTLLRRGIDLPDAALVSPFNGQLFSTEQCPSFDTGPELHDQVLVRVLQTLSCREVFASRERLNFRNLGTDQLGAVYEALLAQRPKLLTEPHVWVESHDKGVGLVPTAWVEGLGGKLKYKLVDNGELPNGKCERSRVQLEDFVARERKGYAPQVGSFVICPTGGAKRQTASFYTPKRLAEYLTERTLKPLVEGKTPAEILNLRILEPSVGCGAFLSSGLSYLARELIKSAHLAKSQGKDALAEVLGTNPQVEDKITMQKARRAIVEQCLYGVDTNPLSLELCRVILYLESLAEKAPLPFLHHHLKQGNTLIGADLRNRFPVTLGKAKLPWAFVPDADAFKKVGEATLEQYDMFAKAASQHGKELLAATSAKELLKAIGENYRAAERALQGDSLRRKWAETRQQDIERLLAQCEALENEFAEIQNHPEIVDLLDERFRDFKNFVPDLDPVIIEAAGAEISEDMEHARKEILVRENGKKIYKSMVSRRRAYQRVRAFAHLASSLRAWPVDLLPDIPTWKEYCKLADILLSSRLDEPLTSTHLGKKGFRALRASFEIARRLEFFHADLEFAGIMRRGGFDAILGNPPWKLIQVKDKDVFPRFDPAYNSFKNAKARDRIKAICTECTDAAQSWWSSNHRTKSMSHWWQNELLARLSMTGKIDLCSAFLLRAEALATPTGAMGFIVSHSAVLVTKNTRNLRERLFSEWGLREATVFENRNKVFDIDSRITFATLVGQRSAAKTSTLPAFVQGVTELAELDACECLFDGKKVPTAHVERVDISMDLVRNVFSPEILAIPVLSSQREAALVEELTQPREGLVRFGDTIVQCSQGLNVKTGPERGLSIYREDLASKRLTPPSAADFYRDPKLVPLYKGSFISHFDPLYLGFGAESQLYEKPEEKLRLVNEKIAQFGLPEEWGDAAKEFLGENKLAWRKISQVANSRTLVCSLVPDGSFADDSVYFARCENSEKTIAAAAVASSILFDNFCRYQVTQNVTSGAVLSLPADLFPSRALARAAEIAKILSNLLPEKGQPKKWKALMTGVPRCTSLAERQALQAELDALIYIQYSRASAILTPDDFHWILDNRFPVLGRQEDGCYVALVKKKLAELWPKRAWWRSQK